MEAVKILKKITDDQLEELNQYKDKNAEIIILSNISDKSEKQKSLQWLNDLKGSCPQLPDGLEFQKSIRKEWDR